jgi:O-succinylbenzoic acid--CoA ligase
MEQALWLNTQKVYFSAIRQGIFPAEINEDEKQPLLFCQEWLNGKTYFTLSTSGTTGTPKKIEVRREQMEISAKMTGKALQLQPGDKALVSLNTRYIGGIMMLVRGLVLNLQLTIIPPSSLPLAQFAAHTHFAFLSFVPIQLQAILELESDKISILNRAKAILLGGAPVSTTLEKQIQQITAPVYQTYGMTETLSHIALRKLNGEGKQAYYTILEGVTISLDERNCLVIHAPMAADNPIVTNDVVQLLSPDTFIWQGRIDNIINSGGVKIQAEKIEKTVEQVFFEMKINCRFFVASLPHPRFGEAVALFIEKINMSSPEEKKLLQKLSNELHPYEIPKYIRYLPAFQETPTGKIDKKKSILQFS